MKLDDKLEEILAEHRLDHIAESLLKTIPWDDLLLAFSNICINRANAQKSKVAYRFWFKKAHLFHRAITSKAATIRPRKKHRPESNGNVPQ